VHVLGGDISDPSGAGIIGVPYRWQEVYSSDEKSWGDYCSVFAGLYPGSPLPHAWSGSASRGEGHRAGARQTKFFLAQKVPILTLPDPSCMWAGVPGASERMVRKGLPETSESHNLLPLEGALWTRLPFC
jgi:hypothetical protein